MTAFHKSQMDSRLIAPHRPLIVLLLIAASIRLPLAFWPNIIHPDEIYQYLEPAWRMLGHDSVISWEWRYGMRGWLVPALLAGPIALGDWIAPGGSGAFIAPRLLAAFASLSIIISAWCLGARISRAHALVAGFVATIWFEFILFAPHTLSEPLATALILPAALLITKNPASPKHLAIGGALVAFAVVFRFQYAPAVAVLALGACWGSWRKLGPMIAGGLAGLAVAGIADAANGATPFAWVLSNIEQNWLNDRAAAFGVMPMAIYVQSFWAMWSLAIIIIVLAIVSGWRHAPLLLAAAVANIAFHGLIGHKEYRFIFMSVVVLVLIAALGSADWIAWLRARRFGTRSALIMVCLAWTLLSGTLAATSLMPGFLNNGLGAARLASHIRNDPELCGLALVDTPVPTLPGRERLTGRSPIYAFDPADPLAAGDIAAAARKAAPAFNRILSPRNLATTLPATYSQHECASVGNAETCIFARDGGCDSAIAAPFILNDVLTRVDR